MKPAPPVELELPLLCLLLATNLLDFLLNFLIITRGDHLNGTWWRWCDVPFVRPYTKVLIFDLDCGRLRCRILRRHQSLCGSPRPPTRWPNRLVGVPANVLQSFFSVPAFFEGQGFHEIMPLQCQCSRGMNLTGMHPFESAPMSRIESLHSRIGLSLNAFCAVSIAFPREREKRVKLVVVGILNRDLHWFSATLRAIFFQAQIPQLP